MCKRETLALEENQKGRKTKPKKKGKKNKNAKTITTPKGIEGSIICCRRPKCD